MNTLVKEIINRGSRHETIQTFQIRKIKHCVINKAQNGYGKILICGACFVFSAIILAILAGLILENLIISLGVALFALIILLGCCAV